MLLHDAFEASAIRHPDKTAIVSGVHRYTYGEIASRANALAAALKGSGVRRGDRCALFLDNGIDFSVAIVATLRLGAVFMPINPLTKTDKLAFMLADARASVLFAEKSLRATWFPALESCPTVHTVFVPGDIADLAADRIIRAWPEQAVGDVATVRVVEAETIDQDLASLIYTSGSTGFPKGVMLTHLNMISAGRSVSEYLGLRASDVIFCALPLAFDYGLYQLLMAFGVGATVVLEKNFAFPVRALERMQTERVTFFPGVPTMFAMLLAMEDLSSWDLASVRAVTNTAAALSAEQILRLRRLFPQATLFSMYGLTECKRVTFLPPNQLDVRPTSVGRGMPNEEVWLVDDDGRRLPNGSTGELVIRGSHVMRGYWERPEETARRLRPGPYPGELVLYSGDLFRTDNEGWLYFVGRRDDIIKTRGEKVSPREVEDAILAHEEILEVAVVGVPDELLGQAVKAFVVRQAGSNLTERQLIAHCHARLEAFTVPKFVEFVGSLPKSANGKICKTGLA